MKKSSLIPNALPRWGLLLTALIAGIALSVTALEGYRSSGEFTQVAGLGQAEVLVRALRKTTENSTPTRSSLEEFLSENDDLGLLYIGFFDLQGNPVAEAGKTLGQFPPLPEDPRERILERIGDRFRFATMLPQRLTRRMFMEMRLEKALQRFNHHQDAYLLEENRPQPRRLVFEFEPTYIKEAKFRSSLTLLTALAASALLTVSAFIFWRLNKNAHDSEVVLEKQRHLASLGEMTAVLAHEIRNPLGVLKGHAQLLEEMLPEETPERNKAGLVVKEAMRLQALINELLDFVGSNKLSFTSSDPAALLKEAADSVDPQRFDLITSSAPKAWDFDYSKLLMALTNLLRNALQASPAEARIQAEVREENNHLVFKISDSGKGVPEDQIEKIFEPFHTGRVRGIGLGLAVTRRVAESHGGTVKAGNRAEGGAIFTLTIPKS